MPVADAPTTSTPRLSRHSGDRYVIGVTMSIEVGTAVASVGTLARFAAPLVMTTVAQSHTPRWVVTRKPPVEAATRVTVVRVWTGASIAAAYESMNATTSGTAMNPSGRRRRSASPGDGCASSG